MGSVSKVTCGRVVVETAGGRMTLVVDSERVPVPAGLVREVRRSCGLSDPEPALLVLVELLRT